MVAAICAAAEMPRPSETPPPTEFEDWTAFCVEDCVVETAIMGRDGMQVLHLRALPEAFLIGTPLPLFLPDPVDLAIGDTEPRAIPWRTCDAGGCEARAPMTPGLLADLRRERDATVALTLEDGARVRIGVSLLGFTAAWRESGRGAAP